MQYEDFAIKKVTEILQVNKSTVQYEVEKFSAFGI